MLGCPIFAQYWLLWLHLRTHWLMQLQHRGMYPPTCAWRSFLPGRPGQNPAPLHTLHIGAQNRPGGGGVGVLPDA